ncbi:RNA-directed DNA polymerase, eukaryota, reverse transcriptase zinc-binding domain protein, partial [Tanacetum coccineum]
MIRLELFRLKTMWGNFNFDYACSMSRGRSGGLISMWDPNTFSKEEIWCDDSFIIVKGRWKNAVGICFMINVYGPQDPHTKSALWNKLADFMHNHNGKFILFGDLNVVRNEQERFGSSLIDLPIGGCYYTWMNKAGTKLSKLDRFLISDDILEAIPDIRITAIDRLCPNGFSFAFVKKYWDLLKKDIFEFVDSFLASGMMMQGVNSSFFTLIPKISKVIDKIVSKEQSAFIAGRQILDGPLILSEVIDWFKKIKKKMLIFTVDLEKAFDSVSWKYLDFVILSLGFGSKWRSWIRACLQSSRAYILINGSPTSEFSIKHGLRQGDPLSLFLFILAMEGLHYAMSNAVSSGLIHGIKIGSSDITLSHIVYAGDVIITTDWNFGDLDNIIRVLYVFYLALGLKTNIHKSNIFGIGVPNG